MAELTSPVVNCPCQHWESPEPDLVYQSFVQVRHQCAALRDILVPDSILDQHRSFYESGGDEARHCSEPILAIQRGILGPLTLPLHRLMLDEQTLRSDVVKQYRSDLAEKWFLADNYPERYKRHRIFRSRWIELYFATWLLDSGWELEGLEVYGGDFDVEASKPESSHTVFEVKYLAEREAAFEIGVRATRSLDGVAVGPLSVSSPTDYLLFRLFQAAKQLEQSPNRKIAVIITEDYETSFRIPLSWVNWTDPKLFLKDNEIVQFIEEKKQQSPDLESEITQRIQSLDEIWIFCVENNFDIHLMHRIEPENNSPEGGHTASCFSI